MRQLPLGVRLRDRAVFASFLPGDNAEAVRHLAAIAAGGGSGVTWIHGPEGAGKSHLLQAVIAAAPPTSRTGYLPLGDFSPAEPAMLDAWRGLDVLCVDDLHAIAGGRSGDEALFRLYRDYEDRGASLVVAAIQSPSDSAWTLPDAGSRFSAAAIFALQPLDEAGRVAALRVRAQLRGLELPDETVRFLERRVPRDMRSLYALLDTLDDAALAAQRRLTVPFVREVLGDT